ncbi:hypothetical protein [Riemerella anatipestifer]|uniref:hypothetical protein n=1 Tax=Riemerella anatipestifer TaxID=34085 RepID=UPI001BD9C859|nr:hypothetical protein [Riemerella anatipestifer]MBT0554276.1 hypothetical protein [Riemerella anatipestifer]MCE3024987.1 hypothetical protein [Riemerella anatipestifer]MDY3449825.1 hypothetical protein [Riemerella anatipestifer]QYR03355.1 hypothetical protein J6M00_02745 [Riemerella anatipestifer]QYR05624.1 hypothetical protein J6M09_02985 [Riemerella anatipestifer]
MKTLRNSLKKDYNFFFVRKDMKEMDAVDIATRLLSVEDSCGLFSEFKDGGTCNFDSVCINLKGKRKAFIKLIEDISNIKLCKHPWFVGRYIIGYNYIGQADRRVAHVDYIYKKLKDQGLDVGIYYQMD